MFIQKRFLTILLLLAFASAAPAVYGGGGHEYKSIVQHLRTKYQAKKVKIPFLFLARFAVSVVRPAGVKEFQRDAVQRSQILPRNPGQGNAVRFEKLVH